MNVLTFYLMPLTYHNFMVMSEIIRNFALEYVSLSKRYMQTHAVPVWTANHREGSWTGCSLRSEASADGRLS